MSVPRNNEEQITQAFEETEGRVNQKTVPGVQQDLVLHFGCSV